MIGQMELNGGLCSWSLSIITTTVGDREVRGNKGGFGGQILKISVLRSSEEVPVAHTHYSFVGQSILQTLELWR